MILRVIVLNGTLISANKGINVHKMLDLILEIPNENSQNLKSTKKVKALKRMKDILIHYMTNTNHNSKFLYELLSDSFELEPNDNFIGDLKGKELEKTVVTEDDENLWQKNHTLLNNEELFKAADRNDLYTLEVLCEGYTKIGLIIPEEINQKVWQLKNEARYVTENLRKIINMEIENDYELNDLLDICLSKAKNIGMRGELIDVWSGIKDFRDKMYSELIEKPKEKGQFDEK